LAWKWQCQKKIRGSAKDFGLAGVFLMKAKPIMKKMKILAVVVLLLNLASVWGQQPPGPARPTSTAAANQEAPALTRFNLDFPGGSPQELVAAITQASGKPLNAVINAEDASSIKLPPLKMNNVTVPQLFEAVEGASTKSELIKKVAGGYETITSGFGFKTPRNTPNDDSVWYFYVHKADQNPVENSCRFYLLTPYLERGLTVDDITTAIKTAWTMLGYGGRSPMPFGGEQNVPQNQLAPEISYHKETKLLIAVGDASKLETIDAVLKALGTGEPTPEQIRVDQIKLQRQILGIDTGDSTNSKSSKTNH
jgi:hypothetical protein